MFFSGQPIKRVRQLIRNGELNQACRLARQMNVSVSSSGRRIANQLIDQLVQRAGRSSVCGDLESAWKDLTDASTIATDRNADRVSNETNRLVNQTIDLAGTLLSAGKPSGAELAIKLLKERKIPDCRADELFSICNMISDADKLAAAGRMKDASGLLQEAKQLRPDLTFLDSRIRNYGYQKSQLADLTSELRFAINESAWNGARDVTNRILQISPNNQIALDAQRRCSTRPAQTPHLIQGPPREKIETQNTDTQCNHSTASGQRSDLEKVVVEPVNLSPATRDQENQSPSGLMKSFMLWVDGVGGYLVCTGQQVTIGRAVPQSGIDIPLQADIRRHHLRFKRVDGGFLAQSLGGVEIKPPADDDWFVLGNRQKLNLGSGVEALFSMSHPLGHSARIEFTSRHRTEPWSDAAILMGDAILLGPDRSSHICCPRWRGQIVIYRHNDRVFLRAAGELEVNGESVCGDVELLNGVQVVGDEFAISCEEVL